MPKYGNSPIKIIDYRLNVLKASWLCTKYCRKDRIRHKVESCIFDVDIFQTEKLLKTVDELASFHIEQWNQRFQVGWIEEWVECSSLLLVAITTDDKESRVEEKVVVKWFFESFLRIEDDFYMFGVTWNKYE